MLKRILLLLLIPLIARSIIRIDEVVFKILIVLCIIAFIGILTCM